MGRLGARAVMLAVCALGVASCGGGTPGARGAGRPLPPYSGHALDLFDDAIEPSTIGTRAGGFTGLDALSALSARAGTPRSDNLLRERTQVGDAVVRARVQTVTSKEEDRGRSWRLGLHTIERLAGAGPLDDDFAVGVAADGPAAGLLRAYESRLVGTTLIAFVRVYTRPDPVGAAGAAAAPDPEGDLHFHIARDAKDELEAVRSATLESRVH
jgi:hypothetical protein